MSTQRYASKVGTSILSAMGLESLIGGDNIEYRKVALNLSNTELIKSLRQNMRTLMFNSSLCDSDLTREIEDKIEHIFKNLTSTIKLEKFSWLFNGYALIFRSIIISEF